MPAARPLLRTQDQGSPVLVDGTTLGAHGERWIEPFIAANRAQFDRLRLSASVETHRGLRVALSPGERIGAIPLLSPATRKVAAGVLVEPRFRWPALGAVMTAIGFRTEPTLGGTPLVPGSARDVPPWLIAGPVLRRLEALLAHRRRGFVERRENRTSPRGRVDWSEWARRDLPAGRWTTLPCTFPDPDDDPLLLAHVRWTLGRLVESLAPLVASAPGRALHERARLLQSRLGPGAAARPSTAAMPTDTGWIHEGLEAMSWVRDERGLGGARILDGLAWDLRVDQLWESWVDGFATELAPRLGLTAASEPRRAIRWHTRLRSMGSLAPDVALRSRERVVLVDAKYKAHLHELARSGWRGASETIRDVHRADLHQVLAYSAVADVDQVDTVLAYPRPAGDVATGRYAFATVVSGRRRVRLFLLDLPFGFGSDRHREDALQAWRSALMG